MVKTTEKELLILQTAMEVFIEKGQHGARMQEIADRAGINKALLHYYFRSKENLYARIFERLFWDNLNAIISLLDQELTFEQYLRSFIDHYIEFLKRNPRLPLFILRGISEGGPVVQQVMETISQKQDKLAHRYLTIFEAAVESGEIRRQDPLQLIATIIGACLFFFAGEPMFRTVFQLDESFDRERFIEERKQAVFNTIAYGVFPKEKRNE